jgi:tetratricopeptide (TPR) repeat protein
VQEAGALEAGFVYGVKEGQVPRRLAPLAAPRGWHAGPLEGDNGARQHNTRFVEPLPLPERREGPGAFTLRAEDLRDQDRAAAWSLFRRYLFEHRAPLELPFTLTLDGQGRAIGLTARPAEQALPYPGVAIDPPRRDYFKLGLALLWSGYSEQALPYLEATLNQQPSNARVMALVSQIHLEANRIDQAQQAAENAVKADAGYAEAWNALGGVAYSRSDFGQALEHYERATSIKSGMAHVLLNAGQAAAKLEQWPRSAGYYQRAMAADAASADAHNGYGYALARQGRVAEAKTYLQKAIELKPDYGAAINNLAVLYLQQGQTDDAIAALQYGIKAAPGEEILYLNLGRTYVQRGDRERARDVMRSLLAVKPDSVLAQRALRDLER